MTSFTQAKNSVQTQKYHYHGKAINARARVMNLLLYLPGAMLLIYGFWLSLTVQSQDFWLDFLEFEAYPQTT